MHKKYIVEKLGKCTIASPLKLSKVIGDNIYDYIDDKDQVLKDTTTECFRRYIEKGIEPIAFEKAGPREFLYFEPAKTKVGIVTCGGLCPGQNDVIRSLVMTLHYRYNVTRIIGFMYGYAGLVPEYNHPTIELEPDLVKEIHKMGGTILGSSRGLQNVETIVDTLERQNINILFTIGGDGTLRGAHEISQEIKKRGLKIVIGGIPKTIDNDINMIDKSFGFETAVTIARDIVRHAHNEATGAYNGVALVKLMGRDSGFIAANAALAGQEVNLVVIPEMDIDLYGSNGLMEFIKKRLEEKHHAVVVVSEGAGQNYFEDEVVEKDDSGNTKYKDIGLFLKDRIIKYFKEKDFPLTLKYIDPSYIIRSAPSNASDSKFCSQLAQNAVHAAMAGRTDFVVGHWNNQFTLLPIPITTETRKRIDLESVLWYNVLEATGQPVMMKNQ